MGEFLYHYTKLQTALEYILPSKTLKFSEFTGTNDPKEREPWFFKFADIDTISNFIGAIKYSDIGDCTYDDLGEDATYNDLYAYVLKKRLKFISFTDVKDGYNKQRMWAQYGESNRGVCLILDKSLLIKKIEDEYNDSLVLYHDFVKYRDLEKFSVPIINSSEQAFGKEVRDYFLFTKGNDWKEEKEYRFILHNKEKNFCENENICVEINGILKEIVLGYQIPFEVYKEDLNKYHIDLDIKISQLLWKNGTAKKKYVLGENNI